MIESLPVPSGAGTLTLMDRVAEALTGTTPFIPYAAGSPPPEPVAHAGGQLPDGLAVAVGTSGSTGVPKLAMLTAGNLLASATATHGVLGGDGQWLLSMPAHHVAGLQVLVRSVVAGTTPVVLDLTDGFTSEAFVAATRRLGSARSYTALVPTQLARLLADPAGRGALTAYAGVLVGGAAVPPDLLDRAREVGATVVTTYGMSETAGGCVYDGRPLPGTRVRRDDDGRLHIGGATVAHGYLGRPGLTEEAFTTGEDGVRWFRTDDVGHQDADTRWHVDGRIDDLITTGGLKVAPRDVEHALTSLLPTVAEALVVGVPDDEWGQVVAAAVVLHPGADEPTLADVRAVLRPAVPRHTVPRRLLVLDTIPLRGPGKPDRRAIRDLLT